VLPGALAFTSPAQTTWAISILPFLEQTAIYNQIDFNYTNADPVNAFLRDIALPVYNCPSDPHAGKSLNPGSGWARPNGFRNPAGAVFFRASSYRGMSSVCLAAANGTPNGYAWNQPAFVMGGSSAEPATSDKRGLLHWVGGLSPAGGGPPAGKYGPVKIRDITDGTSNTLAVGEYTNLGNLEFRTPTTTCAGCAYVHTFWAYNYAWFSTGCAPTIPGGGRGGLIANYERTINITNSNIRANAFGSAHGGGAINFLRTDGSVIAITPNIDIPTYAALASIAGGEVVGEY
jgi:hypothetical protein